MKPPTKTEEGAPLQDAPSITPEPPQFTMPEVGTLRQLIDLPDNTANPLAYEPARSEYWQIWLHGTDKLIRVINAGIGRTDTVSVLFKDLKHYSEIVPDVFPSRRAEALPESRSYIVLQFKAGAPSLDQQTRVIWGMAKELKLTLVCFDANRTLCAWYSCKGASPVATKAFLARAIELAADTACKNILAPVPLPDGFSNKYSRSALAALRKAGIRELLGCNGTTILPFYERRFLVFYASKRGGDASR
jgi:hypothetical protein